MHTAKSGIRRPSAPLACRSWDACSRNAAYRSWDRAFETEMKKAFDKIPFINSYLLRERLGGGL